MIKSNNGKTEATGTEKEVLADLGVIIVNLLRASVNKDDIKKTIEKAVDIYETKYKEEER